MNLDKNTIIGFALLAVLLFGYFYYNSVGQADAARQRKYIEDSIARTKQGVQAQADLHADSSSSFQVLGSAEQRTLQIAESFDTIQTDRMSVVFSNKGARLIGLLLNQIPSLREAHTKLIDKSSFEIDYALKGAPIRAKDLVFERAVVRREANQRIKVSFAYRKNPQSILTHTYIFYPHQYLFDFSISTNNASAFFTPDPLSMVWSTKLFVHEKNLAYEKTQAQLSIFDTQQGFDYFTVGGGLKETIDQPLQWVSIKQQFFNNTLISKESMTQVQNETSVIEDTSQEAFLHNQTKFSIKAPSSERPLSFQFYYGPTSYDELKSYHLGLERIMNIGQGFYAFVKYVNLAIVMPVFNFLKNHFHNFGLVILFLTIFLRVITAPLLYTSYTSSAKMRILKPELDALKQKTGDDQQAYAMKQMELYKNAGVNPLGGCIPALLQIPIFLSLYYFFNSCIDLRGQSFLWADDLSSFDSVYTFGFHIPFYGNHISLFTILNVLTSFLISYTGMKNAPDQGNPMLKYMPYIFPVILLGFFNSLPSSLTWYYTVSNTITLLLQFVIQKYIINHDKLIAQIELKRKMPTKKSSWMQRIEQMQETQKKIQQAKKPPKSSS